MTKSFNQSVPYTTVVACTTVVRGMEPVSSFHTIVIADATISRLCGTVGDTFQLTTTIWPGQRSVSSTTVLTPRSIASTSQLSAPTIARPSKQEVGCRAGWWCSIWPISRTGDSL